MSTPCGAARVDTAGRPGFHGGMCGRYKLVALDEETADAMGVPFVAPGPRYNIAPTQAAPVVRVGASGDREWAEPRWGLVPPFAKDASAGARMINARSETLADRPAFREALLRRRCLVPADGFYEWRKDPGGGHRQPFLVRRADARPFVFAGLWERWMPPGGEPLLTFTILTTAPNALVARLHDRMPVILPRDAFGPWLDPGLREASRLLPMLAPAPDSGWEAVPVGPYVGNPSLDAPICARPLADDPAAPGGPRDPGSPRGQQDLFQRGRLA